MSDLKKLTIDRDELLFALDSAGSMNAESVQNFLDTETGEILALHSDFEDYDDLSEQIESQSERYELIEPLESHESFRIMEDFAESLPESAGKSHVIEALSRNKPFRRFKDVVHSDVDLRAKWFTFRDEAYLQHTLRWLAGLGFAGELISHRAPDQM